MKLESFFEKFELFADAPNAVAKLRELLIQFAVSGKLTPNDPREKPVELSLSGPSPAYEGLWPAGTLCITIAANIADSGILGFDACFPDSIVGFIPASPIPSVRYFDFFMRTAKEHLEQFAPATAQKNINLGILEQVWIPVPPLAEQRRIVAKVEQLMALVDKLETQLAASRATAAKLLEAIVAELTAKEAL